VQPPGTTKSGGTEIKHNENEKLAIPLKKRFAFSRLTTTRPNSEAAKL